MPAIKGYSKAVTLMWRPFSSYARITELEAVSGSIPRLRIASEHEDWTHLRALQLLTADTSADDEGKQPPQEDRSDGRLSTIPEEPSMSQSPNTNSSYLRHSEARWQQHIDEINEDLNMPCDSIRSGSGDTEAPEK